MLTKEEMQYKIDYEIIVDCYDEIEVSMGWYYFMEENLNFPFKATVPLKKRNGSLETKEVKITGLASDEEGFTNRDFNLEMENGDYRYPIAYSRLSHVKAEPETREAFQIWNYWLGK